jgi:hypothetical protein
MAHSAPETRLATRLWALALPVLILAASPALGGEPPVGPHITASAAAQMNVLASIDDSRNAQQPKIDSRLYLGLLHQRQDARLAPLTSYRFLKPDADGRVAVDIPISGAEVIAPVSQAIQARGGTVQSAHPVYLVVRARVHLEDLEAIAAVPGVRRVRTALPPRHSAINVSEGVKTHGADEARTFFGTTGSGVKVGVLSDGVESLASLETSGDLPPTVTVLPGQAGPLNGDEGSAMLEIVHDMAPDASLYFATADTSEEQLAQNILALAAAGCQVIVDDVLYLDESPFEDGPVAQAVNTVTAAGVSYFSSAGNEGSVDAATSGTWEGDFHPNGAISGVTGTAHDFGDGGQSILVTANSDFSILTWAEHYTLSSGIASTDFDLYDMDGGLTTIFDSSTDAQNGSGDSRAVEITAAAFTGERLVVVRKHAGTTSSVPMFNLITSGGELDPALATSGATRGHSAAAHAFSVAATPAAAAFDTGNPSGPYPNLFGPSNVAELFSSDGPRRLILRTDGSEITPGNRTSTGGVVRQKPDVTAADGVSCATPGFLPFFGTSAAAPHAAAIAALLRSAIPSISPDQIRNALVGSAIDIQAPGTDRDTGAGIVMAHAALDRAGVTGPLAPQPMAVDVHTVSGDSSNHDGVLQPGEIVSVATSWKNNQGSPQVLTGAASGLGGPAGPTYTLTDGTADFGSIAAGASADCFNATGNCYLMSVSGTRPAAHWDATFTETLSTGVIKLWKLHVGDSFPDVPGTNPFYPFIEDLFHNGVTGGCGAGNYCPNNAVTRAQMAVFLLKGEHGASYIPPACSGAFPDAPCAPAEGFAVDFIEQLKNEGITTGCGGGDYCPDSSVTRAQMAVFLLKVEHGSGYMPPPCTGVFPDVECSPTKAFAVDFIEQLFHEGITGGCAGGGYCPNNPVLRSQMAVFLDKTFHLALYGP